MPCSTSREGDVRGECCRRIFLPGRPFTCKSLSSVVKMTAGEPHIENDQPIALSSYGVNRKEPLSTADNDSSEWAMRDLNPRHPRCKRGALAN